MNKKIQQFALITLTGILGYMLFTLPGRFLEQYEAALAHGEEWGYLYLAAVGLGLFLLAGALLWAFLVVFRNTRKNAKKRKKASASLSSIPEKKKLAEIQKNLNEARKISRQSGKDGDFSRAIEEGSRRIQFRLENTVLEIAAVGTVSSGKSSVLNALAGQDIFDTNVAGGTTRTLRQIDLPGGDRVKLVDTPGLAEAGGKETEELARFGAASADMMLFVIDGPLKDFEFRSISWLRKMEKRVIVCLNKQDWYSEDDQELLVQKLREQLKGIVDSQDIVVVQAAQGMRRVTRIGPDGSETEEIETTPPDITALVERMNKVIQDERKQIVLCSLLLQSRMLKKDTLERIQRIIISRARKIVDSYTWKAALAAAASPAPILDAAAGLGFSLKMILEIAAVFERKIEMADARQLLNQLLKNLYASVGASALAPAVAQVVASGLKAVPAAGTISGGALQGVVQAVVTRWIGTVMIDYFRARKDEERAADLQASAMEEWKRITSPSQLASLAMEGLKRFRAAEKGPSS